MFQKLILIVTLLVCSQWGFSQSFLNWQLRDRYFSVYAGAGFAGYFGDLTNGHPMSNGLSSYNLGVEARLYSKIAARVQGSYYRIEGSDHNASDSSYNQQRNLSFQSKNWEWQFQAMYYFFHYRDKYHKRRTYEPYAAIGIGQTFYNPKADYRGVSYDLRSAGLESGTYGKSAMVIPVSLGVKAAFNEFLNLAVDIGYRYAFTKHLDDVSGSTSGPFDQGTPEYFLSNRHDQIPIVNQQAYDSFTTGSQRGNGTNDSYITINFSIELYLPKDVFKFRKDKNQKEKILGKPSGYD
ncbi:MAG: hypothetical protein JXR07_00420 [Reichenbachiella sp.]